MGVDCKINLPDNVSIKNVASVIGAVCGCPAKKVPLNNTSWYAEVSGVVVLPTAIVEMARIQILRTTLDGVSGHEVFYHFECRCGRLLSPKSTAFWIAVGRRLVEFFGGTMDYNDCDDLECDYRVPGKTGEDNSPQDGVPWHVFQQRILDIKPITEEEWRGCDQYAAYKIEEM